MDISASIRMGLAKKNMQHETLAAELGVRRETISSWCNGHSVPSSRVQMGIANAFRVSVSEFIKWGE